MRVHKEGTGILLALFTVFFIVDILLFYWAASWVFFVFLGISSVLFLLILNFFRSPYRKYPYDADHLVIAPADGTIVAIEEVYEAEYLKQNCLQISVFMSIFNVHANWYPVNGTVKYVAHKRGRFMAAYLPKSSTDNERSIVAMESKGGDLIVAKQIAGAIARRIVTYACPESSCSVNKQMGFIKFGSRVDVYVPLDCEVLVEMDQVVTGNQTMLARLNK